MAVINKTNVLRKYWLDTMEDQGSRSYEDFIKKGYAAEEEYTRKDYNNKFHSIKDETEDVLKKALTNEKGNYTTPTNKVVTQFERTEEFDDNNIDEGNKEDVLLRNIRTSFSKFTSETRPLKEVVDEKFKKIGKTAFRIACGRAIKRHAFIYGDAGIGKSFTVSKEAKRGVENWAGAPTLKPELVTYHGSVGKALSPLLVFFFMNRERKVILLDDADGFVLSPEEDVQNFLKAILDPDGHKVSASASILDKANQYYGAEVARLMKESKESDGVYISVDTHNADKGKVGIFVNDSFMECTVSPEEAKMLKEAFPMEKVSEKAKRIFEARKGNTSKFDKFGKLRTLHESDFINAMNDIGDIGDDKYASAIAAAPDSDVAMINDFPSEMPKSWYFKSSLIMISNLEQTDLNDAIRSRCDCCYIHLTPEEFMVHAESILPKLDVGKGSQTPPDLIDWAKKESFGIFKACMRDLRTSDGKINLVIGVPLELRLIASMTGSLLARFDSWCLDKGYTADTSKPEVLQEFEKEQAAYFIKYDLMPLMAGQF